MSNYEILKEKYDRLVKDVRTLGMYKKKVEEQNEEIERLNRVLVLRDREIDDLNLLLSKKVEFMKEMRKVK